MTEAQGQREQVVPVCPRHPDRESYVRCQRCERPTCPECQRVAPVGIQCVDCVRDAARTAPRTRTAFGGRPTDGRPLVTWAIIGLCVLGNVLQRLPGAGEGLTNAGAFVPFLVPTEPWRLVTSAFLHDSQSLLPFHLALNMYVLWMVGPPLERVLGRGRFVALYVISAIGGAVGFELLAPSGAMVGASGAVFGLFAVMVLVQRRMGFDLGPLFAVLGINLVIGFVFPGIAWQGHLGGLVAGALGGLAVVRGPRGRQAWVQWCLLAALAAVLLAVAFVASP